MHKKTYFFKKAPAAFCAMLLALTLTVCTVTEYFIECRNLRSEVLRLHVIAQSDSEEDQNIKLAVRDAVLEQGADIFDGSVTAAQAEARITPCIEKIEKAANKVLTDNGFDYTAKASVVNEYFDERQYEDITLPAGNYTAVKVILGEGKGKNWWCVMFPPLCLPAAENNKEEVFAVFNEDGAKVVSGESRYKVRFRIVEMIEKAAEKWRERR